MIAKKVRKKQGRIKKNIKGVTKYIPLHSHQGINVEVEVEVYP